VRALANGYTAARGISRDGRTALLERDRSALPPQEGVIETVPFVGGQPTPIASGDAATWNG
jgi:hypothetical protein